MTQRVVAHIDQGAVVGAQRVARFELGNAVGAQDLPIGAARQNLAAQLRPGENRRRRSARCAVHPCPHRRDRARGSTLTCAAKMNSSRGGETASVMFGTHVPKRLRVTIEIPDNRQLLINVKTNIAGGPP